MKTIAGMLWLLCLAGTVWGAELQVQVDRAAVQTGEEVRLVLSLENVSQFPEPRIPELGDDFDVYFGGTSQQTSFINGRMSSLIRRTYILRPKHEGTFVIPPISVMVDGVTFQSRPITLTVSAAPPPPPISGGETGTTAGTRDIFARAVVDKPSVYLYEQVTFRVQLYTAMSLLQNPAYTEPSTQGFWREPLPARDPYIQTVEGRRYRVMEVAAALFPTTPGTLTIGEAVLECTVEDPLRNRGPLSFFRDSLRDGKRVSLRTDPVTITVKPLPPDPPPGFEGAVGDYSIHLSADRTEVPQGEPVTVTLTLSGTGHLRTINEINLPEMPNFRSYPAQSNEEILRQNGIIGGRITKQFVLVPLTAGRHALPQQRLVTFSPTEGRYKILSGPQLVIQALPGTLSPPVNGTRGDIEVLGQDIHFIETDLPSFVPIGGLRGQAMDWLALVPFPVLAYGGLWIWDRRRRRLSSNIALRRRLSAAREARSLLKSSKKKSGTDQAVLAGIALRNYLADRFNLPRAGLTAETMEEHLVQLQVEARPILEFLERCDAERYAPGGTAAPVDWRNEALGHLKTLEKHR